MANRNIIDRLEKINKVPDKLAPQRIKDMLDEQSMIRPIIEDNSAKPEIRLNSSRGTVFRTLAAAAAVFVIALGGIALSNTADGKNKVPLTHTAKSQPQTADTVGLEGLRGGTYRSLFNFFKSRSDPNLVNENVQSIYAFMSDEKAYSDKEISDGFRSYYQKSTAQYRLSGTDNGSEKTQLAVSSGSAAFAASYTNVYGYKLQGDATTRISYDFFSETYFADTLSQNESYKKLDHTLKPYIVDMYLENDRLTVLFGFHLPVIYGEKTVMNEYCGFCVYDVSDIDNISLIFEYEQPGALRSTRLTDDGQLLLLSDFTKGGYIARYKKSLDSEDSSFFPMTYENGEVIPVSENKLYISDNYDSAEISVISSFDLGCSNEENTDKESTDSTDNISSTKENDSSTESQDSISSVKKCGDMILTLPADSALFSDSGLIFVSGYSDNLSDEPEADSADAKGHIIEIDFTDDGPITTKAKYFATSYEFYGSNIGYLSSISQQDGYTYLYSYNNNQIFIFDDDLNIVNTVNDTGMMTDYSSHMTDNYVVGMSAAVVLNGSKAYIYNAVATKESSIFYDAVCTSIIDMSDPYDPKVTDLDSAEEAPALLSRQYFQLDENHTADLIVKDDDSATLELRRTDSNKTVQHTGYKYNEDDSSVITYDIEEKLDIMLPEKTASVDIDHISIGYDNIYFDSQNSLLFITDTEYSQKNITVSDEEYSKGNYGDYEITDVEKKEDGEFYYEVQISVTQKIYCTAVKVDLEKNKLDVLGKTEIYSKTSDAYSSEENLATDFVFLNGKLYSFTDKGMSCCSLKDTSKILYSDNF